MYIWRVHCVVSAYIRISSVLFLFCKYIVFYLFDVVNLHMNQLERCYERLAQRTRETSKIR